MLERKSKISAKLYGNVVKVSKETLKTHSISAFATEKKNETVVLMLGKKSKISESCMKKVIRTSKETLKMR